MTRSSRFEYKYLVSETAALRFARELRPFMRMDPWLQERNLSSYVVSSVYMDSPRLTCYEAVEQGAKNRFKLRMRWYGEKLSAPVFLEEKRRISDSISKARVTVDMKDAADLLAGNPFNAGWMNRLAPGERALGEELLGKIRSLGAVPSCVVRYEREAWESPVFRGLRVTFDRSLTGAPTGEHYREGSPTALPATKTILEVKFRDHMPEWLGSLMRRYHLTRVSVPKYVLCVDALRSAGMRLPLWQGGITA